MQIGLKPNMNPGNSFPKRVGRGFKAGVEGLKSLFQEGLIIYAILPAFIGLVSGAALAFGTYTLLEYWMIEGLGATGALDSSWFSWLGSIAVVLSIIASFFVYIGLYRFIISIVIFPLLGPMIDRLELEYRGKKTETTFKQDLGAAIYGGWIGLLQALAGLLILVVSFFTGPLQPFLLALADGYFYGYGAFSVILERDFPDNRIRRHEFSRYRGEILGLGLLFVALLAIPLLGALLAPIACVAGASKLYYTRMAPSLSQVSTQQS
ncbi:MAG: EI24 domain-containing protein [Leptospiraceae bacterium]